MQAKWKENERKRLKLDGVDQAYRLILRVQTENWTEKQTYKKQERSKGDGHGDKYP